jgi:PEP-CTERM motif
MKKLLLTSVLLGGTALVATPANAVLQFALDINGATFACVDNTACDTNGAVGIVQTAPTTFNGVSFLGSSQTQLTGGTNELTTTSFQITNNNPGTISYQIAVGGNDFVGPVTNVSESGSGTWTNAVGSTITQAYYADATNTQGANTPTDFPGTLQFTSSDTAALVNDSFSASNTSAFSAPGLFSMTEGASGTIVAGGQLTGRSQSELAFLAVPEPTSLGLLATGVLALGFLRRKPRVRKQPTSPAENISA